MRPRTVTSPQHAHRAAILLLTLGADGAMASSSAALTLSESVKEALAAEAAAMAPPEDEGDCRICLQLYRLDALCAQRVPGALVHGEGEREVRGVWLPLLGRRHDFPAATTAA